MYLLIPLYLFSVHRSTTISYMKSKFAFPQKRPPSFPIKTYRKGPQCCIPPSPNYLNGQKWINYSTSGVRLICSTGIVTWRQPQSLSPIWLDYLQYNTVLRRNKNDKNRSKKNRVSKLNFKSGAGSATKPMP